MWQNTTVPINIIKNDVDQRIGRRKNVGFHYLLRREIVDTLNRLDPKREKNEAKMKELQRIIYDLDRLWLRNVINSKNVKFVDQLSISLIYEFLQKIAIT